MHALRTPVPAAPLVEMFRSRARGEPDREVYRFVEPNDIDRLDNGRGWGDEGLTYGQLDTRVRALAAHLQDRCEVGDRALLLHPPGLDFVVS